MSISVTIPTPPAAGQEVRLRIGKVERVWASPAQAVAWAQDQSPDLDTAFAYAILLAANRPAMRGKTLTINPAAAANLVTVS